VGRAGAGAETSSLGARMEEDRRFWEECNPCFSHVEIREHLHNETALEKSWERDFVKSIDWEGRKVLDYGIGKGLLGTLLHRDYGIREYVGVDIAVRSLVAARAAHRGRASSFLAVKEFYRDVPTADVFVSQACIQHFPSVEYLVRFLEAVVKSEASVVMLQIAQGGTAARDTSVARARGKLEQADVVRGLYTEKGFLLEHLPGYMCTRERKGLARDYVFLTFEKAVGRSASTAEG
jgi:SAM-dependent methyltransferase